MKALGRCATLAAWSLLATLSFVAPAHAAFPGSNGKIAFERDRDIYSVNPDGTGLTNLTATEAPTEDGPAWTSSGRHIAFRHIQDGGPDSGPSLRYMSANGFHKTPVVATHNVDPTWSPDSRYLAYEGFGGISILQVSPRVFVRNVGLDQSHHPAWAPDGTRIAYSHNEGFEAPWHIRSVRPDGSGDMRLTSGPGAFQTWPNWSPDGTRIAFVAGGGTADGIYIMNADGSNVVPVPDTANDIQPAWSPDGTKLVVSHFQPGVGPGSIDIVDPVTGAHTPVTTGPVGNPDWGPTTTVSGYPRPKGATPLSVPLVPAYRSCDAPNREHGPPLAFDSCNPAQPESDYLTVGTPDANGNPAKSSGSVTMQAVVGNPATPADESDVKIEVSITDVRCKTTYHTCGGGPLSDYAGELQGSSTLRITDFRKSVPAYTDPMTTDEFFHSYAIPCAVNGDPAVGSTCSLTTSVNATTPGTVEEGSRAIWQLGRVEIRDGGPDGTSSTDDYTMFATQGLFIP